MYIKLWSTFDVRTTVSKIYALFKVPQCEDLRNPTNDILTIIHDANPAYGTLATYSCENGIIGDNTRICQCNGQWSEEPLCASGMICQSLQTHISRLQTVVYCAFGMCGSQAGAVLETSPGGSSSKISV